jgi:hypothetical protein
MYEGIGCWVYKRFVFGVAKEGEGGDFSFCIFEKDDSLSLFLQENG